MSVSPTRSFDTSLSPVTTYPTSPAVSSLAGFIVGEKKPSSSASNRVGSAIVQTFSPLRNTPSTTRMNATTPRYWSYDESKISARGGASRSPVGAGTRSTTASSTASTPRPVLAEIRSTSSGLPPIRSETSAAAPSGSADGRSILFAHGTISRLFSIAR